MCRTQNEQKTKPKLDYCTKRLAGTVHLQAVFPEQNDIVPLPTIKNSATLVFALNSTTSGNTVYKLPLAVWRKVFWHEAGLQ
jgi:hypothetical protein